MTATNLNVDLSLFLSLFIIYLKTEIELVGNTSICIYIRKKIYLKQNILSSEHLLEINNLSAFYLV